MASLEANIPGEGCFRISIGAEAIDRVERLGPENPEAPCCSAGFVDIQINGFAGVDFSAPDLDAEAVLSILPALWATGATSLCPTLISNSLDQLERNFRVLEAARKASRAFDRTVPCYHLEGPFLSPGASHGVHDPRWMRSPDWDEFERLEAAAGGHIGILTIAPELPGAPDVIRSASRAGVVVAVGHTDGKPEDIHRAVECGATLSTHLGNGCPDFIHRHQSPIWPQLALDPLSASIICDGFHLPADLVRVIYRAKGPDRCLLITDAVHAAGLPPSRYFLAGLEIELLPDGKVVALDRHCLAGSSLSMNRAVPNFARLAQTSLAEGLRAASTNPAQLLGNRRACRAVTPGEPANLVVFQPRTGVLEVQQVFLRGERVYTTVPL